MTSKGSYSGHSVRKDGIAWAIRALSRPALSLCLETMGTNPKPGHNGSQSQISFRAARVTWRPNWSTWSQTGHRWPSGRTVLSARPGSSASTMAARGAGSGDLRWPVDLLPVEAEHVSAMSHHQTWAWVCHCLVAKVRAFKVHTLGSSPGQSAWDWGSVCGQWTSA